MDFRFRQRLDSRLRPAWIFGLLTLLAAAMGAAPVRPRSAPGPGLPRVVQFSPVGTVKPVRQVVARFSHAMVPLGDPRAAVEPFNIDCAAKATARWIDSFTWSYDFAQDVPAGVRCRFILRPGLKTLAGASFAGTPVFSFDTGGPAVVDERPWADATNIDERQAFVLVLDADPDPASIVANASFSVAGIAQRVGVTIVQGADRAVLAKRFARMVGHRPFVIIQARQTFPAEAAVHLIWGKGIKSHSGIATARDQRIDFKVRKAFAARLVCQRENARAGCIPLTPIEVRFTSPIMAEQARRIMLIAPGGARLSPGSQSAGDTNSVAFPPPFQPGTTYRIELPADLSDESGRRLVNASQFPSAVVVDELPPLAKFAALFGIIESTDPVLPITVRDLEAQIRGGILKLDEKEPAAFNTTAQPTMIATVKRLPAPDAKLTLEWLRRVADAKRNQSVFAGGGGGERSFAIPKPAGATPFEVMGIPLKNPGLYIVEIRSERLGTVLLGSDRPMYVPTAALVTNLAVHFKHGRANSLIWVTRLEDAGVVGGARVAIADCRGDEVWSGQTDSRGIAMVPHLAVLDKPPGCEGSDSQHSEDYYTDQVAALQNLGSGLLVTARYQGDFSFVRSSWSNGIEAWRFNLPTTWEPTPYIAHTVFDRTLLRAGETVHMKHFIRAQTLDGFAVPDPAGLPDTVSIRFADGDPHYDFALSWRRDGSAVTDWKIPDGAKLGTYRVVMLRRAGKRADADSGNEVESGGFQVEEFRVPLMTAAIKLPAAPQARATQLPVDVSVAFFSGGPARGLPVVLRSEISNTVLPSFPDAGEFTFANGPVREGVRKFGSGEDEGGAVPNPGVHQRIDLKLDAAGGARTQITAIPRAAVPQDVRAELEFRDPNGETQTVSNVVTIWPARLIVGISGEDWTSSRGMVRARVAVLDDAGHPMANVKAVVTLLSRKFFSYRQRLIGGFYTYENTEEVKRIGVLCEGVTDNRGRFACIGKPGFSGEAVLQAEVADGAGGVSIANTSVYLQGATRIWFPGQDDDRMDIIAERPEYDPGAVARFQVRMPFAAATALVTVEREGILSATVTHLDGKDPVVTVPIGDYAPNVFVSVMAVRGRISGIAPLATVDLGKPAFKLGITGIRVRWREHRLSVTVTPARLVYHVREQARVKVVVRMPDGHAPPPGGMIALAAIDEGLLELKPNESWKLLDAMMDQRPYQVETSTAAMQVVGRRHFGLKALPPGGGGGRHITRELFNTLLLWKADVVLDSDGTAEVAVPLNDSLTSFRIVAIASVGSGEFGTGSATIRSTQDLQLYSGVAPIARNGDVFAAGFTVRNASDRTLTVNVNAAVDGLNAALTAHTLSLAPGAGRTITWPVDVPGNVAALKYHVDATAAGGLSDHLLIVQQVIPAVPVRTWQATLAQLDKPVSLPVAVPAGAVAGQGGVAIALSPSLTAGLSELRAWMRAYPYLCMEQRVSRAVALRDPALWNGIVADLPTYTDGDGMLKYFPAMRQGSDVLTAYVLAIADEAGLALPQGARARALAALDKFVEGKLTRPEPFAAVDLPLRKLTAIEALSRYNQAVPRLLGSIRIDPDLWPDSALIDWASILSRVPSIADRARRLRQAETLLRARINQQGTAMQLASDPRNDLWWLMVSPARNMVRLTLLAMDARIWRADTPRIMRGALAMQRRGAWPETITNAWGSLAIAKFAAQFESPPVTGVTKAALGSATAVLDWNRNPEGGVLGLAWPLAPATLGITHAGSGHPWAAISTRAAIPLKSAFTSGYSIIKTMSPVDNSHAGAWQQGDLVRIHLTITAQTDMTWVVVDDPIPAGASHLGTGLARESRIATAGENANNQSRVWPAYVERSFGAFRAYYDYVPKGTFEIEYTIRLNQAGVFRMPPTHVEALYEPEMLGEIPNPAFTVAP